jgi:hypothetical protein
MAGQQSKGNPAGKRMGNAQLKARRASSWSRGQKRKIARATEVLRRERHNAELRLDGLPTPWELARASRKFRRLVKGRKK